MIVSYISLANCCRSAGFILTLISEPAAILLLALVPLTKSLLINLQIEE